MARREAAASPPWLAPAATVRQIQHDISQAAADAVVLIDGPSGAGKSTLADYLVATWPDAVVPQLVRLDDIYPGWNGLDAGAEQVTMGLLRPRRAGEPAGWQRWDWTTGTAAEWHPVDAGRPIIVEGCGALARANAAVSDIRIWLDADELSRKERALQRDGGAFDAYWDQWQAEWDAYCRRENPAASATARLYSTGAVEASRD